MKFLKIENLGLILLFICHHGLSRQYPLEIHCGCLGSPCWTSGWCSLQTLLRAQSKVIRRSGLDMWTSITRDLRVEQHSSPFWPLDYASLISETHFCATLSYLCHCSRWLMKKNLPSTKDARDNAGPTALFGTYFITLTTWSYLTLLVPKQQPPFISKYSAASVHTHVPRESGKLQGSHQILVKTGQMKKELLHCLFGISLGNSKIIQFKNGLLNATRSHKKWKDYMRWLGRCAELAGS